MPAAGIWGSTGVDTVSLMHGRAQDCMECRQCECHCPQHIEITRHLREVSEKFDGFKGW